MSPSKLRFPAEWEPQCGVMIAWPHAGTDWAERLDDVERSYQALATAIARYQTVLICVPDEALKARAEQLLAGRVDPQRLRFQIVPYDDTWLRDSGPITLLDGTTPVLHDFRFTGWGGKYRASLDDALVGNCFAAGLFSADARHASVAFSLEGGAIETDGAGNLLTTWACLHQRHPEKSREQWIDMLSGALQQSRVMVLDRGYLEGDDTDAHIDTLARFAPDGSIVYQACSDPADPHYAELGAMAEQLAALRDGSGQPYPLRPLPWAQPILDQGRRLAASYANYLIINGAVLVPSYDDPADAEAQAVIAAAHPGRTVVPVPCRALIWQNGSLHCVTMQLPQGVLRD